MAKPDPALLEPGRYPFYVALQTRFCDLDPNAHVNNVALTTMIEDARVRLFFALDYPLIAQGFTLMVVSLTVEFLGQAYCPDMIEAHCAITGIGRTSYTVAALLRQNGRDIAFATAVCVCVQADRATAIPPAMADALRQFVLRDVAEGAGPPG